MARSSPCGGAGPAWSARCARRLALRIALAAMVFNGAPAVQAGQFSLNVNIQVDYISSSGTCAALQAQVGVGVVCAAPNLLAGGTLPGAPANLQASGVQGTFSQDPSFRHVVTVPYGMGLLESLPVYAAGAEILSWRTVLFHNGAYVELTIAW